MSNLIELTTSLDLVLTSTEVSRLEMQNTLNLWRQPQRERDLTTVRVLISKVPPVGRVGQEARDALGAAGVTCLDTVIRRHTAYERATEAGGLIRDIQDDRAAKAWADILAVAKEVRA